MKPIVYYIYLFRVNSTGEIIYVGSTAHMGERINGHRRAFREEKYQMPIHKYMIENGLRLFDDVSICVVECLENVTKEEALKVEETYFYKYRQTLKNFRPAEIRGGEFGARNKPVRCLNDGLSFPSVRLAALHYGIGHSGIMYSLNKGSHMKNGLVFEYVDASMNVPRNMYRVMCVEDNKYFGTYKACAEHYGLSPQQFLGRSRSKDKFTVGSKTFVKCNDHPEREYTQAGGNGEGEA